MAAGDPRFPGASVEDASLASWLARTPPSADEDSLTRSFHELPSGSSARQAALVELVKADLARRWSAGEAVSLEFYLEVLPELGTRDTIPAELILAEYQQRCQAGAPVDPADYLDRFPGQIELVRRLIERSRDPGSRSVSTDLTGPVDRSRRAPSALGLQSLVPVRLPRQFGRYRIVKKLGQGAMGTVYLAHDSQLDRRVALKVPHVTPGRDKGDADHQDLSRFYREVRTAATLHHPNLCPVYDQGEIDGIYYVTMAYIRGRPLSALINPAQPLSQRWVAGAVRKLARALSEAHNQGVIHRDLKPSNIMVTRRSELVIMDFGLAWRAGSEDARLTQSGTILGTPAYMSPEQLSGVVTEVGPQGDIYSLGVIFYELLTASRPFHGPTAAVMAQILYSDPQPPSVRRPDVDPRLEAICLKAMAKKTADRYRTMGELAAALGYCLRARPGSARPRPALGDAFGGTATEAPDSATNAPLLDPLSLSDPLLADSPPQSPAVGDLTDHVTLDVDPTAGSLTVPDDRALAPERDEPPAGPAPESSTTAGLATIEPAPVPGVLDADSDLESFWREWLAIIELVALRRTRRRVKPEEYQAIHGGLIRTCRARLETSDETRRPLYARLMTLAQPWLTTRLLLQTDREILIDLLICCREVDLELHGLPHAARDLRDQIATYRESAEQPLSSLSRFWIALGMCLSLLLVLAMVILAIW